VLGYFTLEKKKKKKYGTRRMLKLEGNHFISQLPGSLGRRLEATLRLFLITRRVKALITGTVSGVTLLTFCGKVAESPILFRIYRLSTAMFFILLLPALCYSLRFQPKQRRRSPFDSRSIITGFGNALGVIAIVVYDGQASQIVTEILDELLVWGSWKANFYQKSTNWGRRAEEPNRF